MFTRDIKLVDCILDLIDNSIDGLIRVRKVPLSTISGSIFKRSSGDKKREGDLPAIDLEFDETRFEIRDNCGGIDYDFATKDAFNFGPSSRQSKKYRYLGAYGVGMKRALFKLGDHFEIQSATTENGFRVELDVAEWIARDDTLEDWKIPIKKTNPAKAASRAGTSISITRLHKEVGMRFGDTTLHNDLEKAVSRTYAFFLDKYVRVRINGVPVKPFSLPVGRPAGGKASFEKLNLDGVRVTIISTLASYADNERPKRENSGWYIVCNGRTVLGADTSDVSGWGVPPMPQWVSKYTSFVGFVFFESEDPLLLPWTTTKRNLNEESMIYQRVKNRMAVSARPVLSFLSRKYPSDSDEKPYEREVAKHVERASISTISRPGPSTFTIPPVRVRSAKTTISVQYDAERADVEKIKKALRNPRMTAREIGEYTFQYFLRNEGLR
ncbi:MAG: ATP-binding protein [bacterium]